MRRRYYGKAYNQMKSTNEKEDAGNQTKSKFTETIEALEKMLKTFLTVASVVGVLWGLLILIINSLKAYWFSNFYNIPFVELTSFSSTSEIIIKTVFPVVIAFFWAAPFAIVDRLPRKGADRAITCFMNILLVLCLSVLVLYLGILYYSKIYNVLPSHSNTTDDVVIIGIIVICLCFLFGHVFGCIMPRSDQELSKGKRTWGLISSIVLVLASLATALLLFAGWYGDLLTWVDPDDANRPYEIIMIDGDEYVTIANNSKGKIVMKCTEKGDTLCIDVSSYKYYDPSKSEKPIVSKSFSKIERDEDPKEESSSENLTEPTLESTNESMSESDSTNEK